MSVKQKITVWVATDSPDSEWSKRILEHVSKSSNHVLCGPWKNIKGLPNKAYNNWLYIRQQIHDFVDVMVCVLDHYESFNDTFVLGGMAFSMHIPVLVYSGSKKFIDAPWANDIYECKKGWQMFVKRLNGIKPHVPELMLPRAEGYYEEVVDTKLGGWWHVQHTNQDPPDEHDDDNTASRKRAKRIHF